MSSIFVLVSVLFFVGAYSFYKWRKGRERMYKLVENIPGERGIPLLGNIEYLLYSPKKAFDIFFHQLGDKEKFRDMFKFWFGPVLYVGLLNPDDIEVLLSSTTALKKSIDYDFFRPWFGNGLLISTGETWKRHRKAIAPTFHLSILKGFMNEFNCCSKRVIDRMAKEGSNVFDCHDYLGEVMVETLLETVMGVKVKENKKDRKCWTYATAVLDMCLIIYMRQTRIWMRPNAFFRWSKLSSIFDGHLKTITQFTKKVVTQKRDDYLKGKNSTLTLDKDKVNSEKLEERGEEEFSFGKRTIISDDIDDDYLDIGEKRRLPFLESMIDRSHHGDGLTDREILDQVNTIMFEGHDTTAAGSSFFLCVMGVRPDLQEKCIAELDSIFGGSDRDVTYQDTLQMKFLERCIMETLRMFPPVPVIGRKLEEDVQLRTNVGIIIMKMQRRADLYTNPNEFDPDRFLPENSVSRHYYGFIPFSAGPRSCVGRKYAILKLKVLLANILRRFKVKCEKPIEKWEFQSDIILKRSDGFNISIEERRSGKS